MILFLPQDKRICICSFIAFCCLPVGKHDAISAEGIFFFQGGNITWPCITPYIRLVKFQLVRQIPDVYVSACVLAAKLFLLFFLVLVYFS